MAPEFIALFSALSYAFCIIAARRGLATSTPSTVTLVSLIIHATTLWTAVFLRGGIPPVATTAVVLFVIAGSLQPIIRLFTYTGVEKIGASRSYMLRGSQPLFSTIIAITVLKEEAGSAVLLGTILIVVGIMFISSGSAGQPSTFRWWHLLFLLIAAFLAGVVHPIRRYALSLSDEPLFLRLSSELSLSPGLSLTSACHPRRGRFGTGSRCSPLLWPEYSRLWESSSILPL